MARPIIIDSDPGTDDAVAILLALAAPELDLLGIVAVAGNLPLEATERNARSLCALAGRPEIAVYAGCARPMGRPLVTAEHVHGSGGLGRLVLPPPSVPLRPEHGVDFLIDAVRGAEPRSITLSTLGPLTDVAMALVKAPDIALRLGGVVMMGGGSNPLGNVTPAAEFNIYVDPHAAALVFESGLPITMIPLDVTETVESTARRVARVRSLGNRCGNAAARLMVPPSRGRRRPSALHDPCVIAYLLAPELFKGGEVYVAVETCSELTLGMTLIDWRGVARRPPNARVMRSIDVEGFYTLLTERLARLP